MPTASRWSSLDFLKSTLSGYSIDTVQCKSSRGQNLLECITFKNILSFCRRGGVSSMAAVDHLLAVLRKHQDPQTPPDCVGRFLCSKFTWRGKYQRVLCITPTAVVTQHPDNLAITNTWGFAGEADIDGFSVGPGSTEFSLSVRKDAQVRHCLHMLVTSSALSAWKCSRAFIQTGLTGRFICAEQVQG